MLPLTSSNSPRRTRALTTTIALLLGVSLVGGCVSSGKNAPPNPYLRSDTGAVTIGTLRVFGDSYSVPSFSGTPTWPTYLAGQTNAERIDNYAIGGAPAASVRGTAFNRQLDSWAARGSNTAARDHVVVYFGYNDLGRTGSGDNLASARAGYRTGVDRLINAGAASDDRRLFLTLIHDWSKNPGVNDGVRPQVIDWNNFIAGEANRNPNVIAVDLFTVFERLYDNPARFGFNNVTTVDLARSGSDALYRDALHFGTAGQQVISRVYLHYITRGWGWASRVNAGGAAAAQLNNDIDNGLLLINHRRQNGLDSPLGLVSIGTGNATVVDRIRQQSLRVRDQQLQGDHASTLREDAAATGFMMSYQLGNNRGLSSNGPGHRLGLAVARNQSQFNAAGPADWYHGETSTDSLVFHWQQDHSVLLGVTQLGFHSHTHDQLSSDNLLAFSADNRDTGRTWRLSHRISSGLDTGPVTLVPNLTLAYQADTLDSSVMQSLYTSPVSFGRLSASHSLADLGLSMMSNPIALGRDRHLQFTGSLNREFGIHQDALEVRSSEQRLPGVVQVDQLERNLLSRLHVSAGADLALTSHIHLGVQLTQMRDYNTNRNSTLGTLNARVNF